MSPDNNGEFRGATRAQIEFLTRQLAEIRSEVKDITAALIDLRDFKTRVLAYAGLAAAVATLCSQFLLNRTLGP